MSYHLSMEKDSPQSVRKMHIDMPPLPPEVNQEQTQSEQTQPEQLQSSPQEQTLESYETPQNEELVSSPEPSEQSQPAQVPQETKKESTQAKNFRELREKAERAQQERDMLAQRLKEYESHRAAPKQEEPDLHIAPDDLVEGKHLSKFIKQQKELEARIKQYEQQAHQNSAEARLKAKYSDFDRVVTKENVEELIRQKPSFGYTLQQSASNIEAAGETAYDMIKLLKIDAGSQYDEDKERAQRNANKPRPLTSVSPQQGDTPMSRANAFANGLTPELQQQLLKEMNSARKGY
jgi:hypothetical protein